MTLFVIATPIGNLGDISLRAKETLEKADLIIAEDTRSTKKLLQLLGVSTNALWKSFHAQSSEKEKHTLVHLIKEHSIVALVSDAGTPAISDPGVTLVHEARKNDIEVYPLPGPSAVIAALCASGFPSDRFEFLGFLPHKKGRNTLFQYIEKCDHTAIFYESTHRIIKCLEQMKTFLPNRRICIAKEMTKMHEEFVFGTPAEVLAVFLAVPEKAKGEFVVLVSNQKHSNFYLPQKI